MIYLLTVSRWTRWNCNSPRPDRSCTF